ncbi:MAG: hypothetical protein WCK63_10720 [Betaproteobacteria bacterium]
MAKKIMMRQWHHQSVRILACVLGLLGVTSVDAQQVICHYTYGGETQQLVVQPVASPYATKGVPVGSFFEFRAVFQNKPADIAAIKIYTYAEREEGTVLVHQAVYPYPPARHRMTNYGFTGVHFVYEAMSNAELKYWCELEPAETAYAPARRAVP